MDSETSHADILTSQNSLTFLRSVIAGGIRRECSGAPCHDGSWLTPLGLAEVICNSISRLPEGVKSRLANELSGTEKK